MAAILSRPQCVKRVCCLAIDGAIIPVPYHPCQANTNHNRFMMTPSIGNIFCVIGPLCWEFAGYRWIPLTKAWWRGALVFSFSKSLSTQPRRWWLETPSCLLWRHSNVMKISDLSQRWCNKKVVSLTHWGRDEIDAIFQTTLLNAFSWMKMYELRLRFHWHLFLRFELTIFQHWFR